MKTLEMLKKLRENPEKRFRSIPLHELEASTFAIMFEGKIFFKNKQNDSVSLYYIDLDWEWEEVKEPVSFLQTLEMIKNNKATNFSLINRKHCIDWINIDLCELLYRLGEYTNLSESANGIIAEILLDSEFYIED